MDVRQLLEANRMEWILDEESKIDGVTQKMKEEVDSAIVKIVVAALPMEGKAKLPTEV